eukprot:2617172-Amphidinium_carterae.2
MVALQHVKQPKRPRKGQGDKLQPWRILHTNANNWMGAQIALEAAQYEAKVDILGVAQTLRNSSRRCKGTQPSTGLGSLTQCAQTGSHKLATSGGVGILVKRHIGSTAAKAEALEGRSVAAVLNTLMQCKSMVSPTHQTAKNKH